MTLSTKNRQANNEANHHNGLRLSLRRTQRREKSRLKRKLIIAIWSIAFAYLSFTSTPVDSAAAKDIGDWNDVYPNGNKDALTNTVTMNQGNVVIFNFPFNCSPHRHKHFYSTVCTQLLSIKVFPFFLLVFSPLFLFNFLVFKDLGGLSTGKRIFNAFAFHSTVNKSKRSFPKKT